MNIGTKVKWTSQSNGSRKTKEGEIIEVIKPGSRPRSVGHSVGLSRKHESYVVKVGNKNYWPRVSALTIVS